MDTSGESRFAHLLQPIRDLAKNWDIDIASELEEYLGELEAISFEIDGAAKPLNFAEAALLIQGSAIIYSKKVEYLYSLIFKALDVVTQKGSKKSQPEGRQVTSIRADGRDADVFDDDDLEFKTVDEALEEANNIDLIEDIGSETGTGVRPRMSLAFSLSLSSDNPGEAGGLKNEASKFKMNSCTISDSGALMLGSGLTFADDLLDAPAKPSPHLNVIHPHNISLLEDEDGIMMLRREGEAAAAAGANPVPPVVQPLVILGNDDSDDDSEEGDRKRVESKKQSALTRAARHELNAAINDMWEELDPHDVTTIAPKPFRKGRTWRIPATPARKPAKQELEYPSIYKVNTTVGTSMLKPFFSEFDYIYERNLKKRMVQRRKEAEAQKKKLASTTDLVAIIAAQAEEDEEVDETGAWAHGAAIAGDEEEVQATAPALGDDDEDNEGAIELYNAPADAGLQSRAQDEVHEMIFMTSYEDLCRSHIEKYLKEAEQYQQETDLSLRVADWNRRLEPLLTEQNDRPAFDIHYYGGRLIERVAAIPSSKSQAIPFGEVLSEAPPFEVARSFSALLQLVNDGNFVLLVSKPENERETHQISLQLLSEEQRSHSNGDTAEFVPAKLGQPPLAELSSKGVKPKPKKESKNKKRKDPSEEELEDISNEIDSLGGKKTAKSRKGNHEAAEEIDTASAQPRKAKRKSRS